MATPIVVRKCHAQLSIQTYKWPVWCKTALNWRQPASWFETKVWPSHSHFSVDSVPKNSSIAEKSLIKRWSNVTQTATAATVCITINQKQARQRCIANRSNRIERYHVLNGLVSFGQISRAFPNSYVLCSSRPLSKMSLHGPHDQCWRFLEEKHCPFGAPHWTNRLCVARLLPRKAVLPPQVRTSSVAQWQPGKILRTPDVLISSSASCAVQSVAAAPAFTFSLFSTWF